jgi:hypothetical protein
MKITTINEQLTINDRKSQTQFLSHVLHANKTTTKECIKEGLGLQVLVVLDNALKRCFQVLVPLGECIKKELYIRLWNVFPFLFFFFLYNFHLAYEFRNFGCFRNQCLGLRVKLESWKL